jgi:serine/threonine protein kinase
MPLAPGTRLGSYEILTQIGAGGMGEVWKARDTRLDRIVAIKQLKQVTLFLSRNTPLAIGFARLTRASISH